MGRHDDPDPAPFYASMGNSVLRGLLALFVAFGLYAVIDTVRNGNEPPQSVALDESREPARQPQASVSPSSEDASNVRRASDGFALDPDATAAPAPKAPVNAADPKNTTVQVLDAGGGSQATATVVRTLKDFGYKVVAESKAVRTYQKTTVFYSRGQEAAARDLKRRDTRFVEIGPNPNLDEAVDLHVIVGADLS